MEGKGGKTWGKGNRNHTSRHAGLRVVKVPSILSKRKIKKAKSNACFEGSLEEKAGVWKGVVSSYAWSVALNR